MFKILPHQVTPEKWLEAVENNYIDCKVYHPGISCYLYGLARLLKVASKVYKYYIPFHLIPFLLFKRKELAKKPISALLKLLKRYIKSILFMSLCIGTLTWAMCLTKHITHKITVWPQTCSGFACILTVFLESEGRRDEICLFGIPRFLETFWNFIKHRGIAKPIFGGENLLFGLATGILAYFYYKEPKAIKSSYYSAFEKFLEKN